MTEDIESDEDNAGENEVTREESWTGDLMWGSRSGPREIAGTLDAPANASACGVGYALIHAYESGSGHKGDGGNWDLALGRRQLRRSDRAAASLPLFLPHALDRMPPSVAIIGEMSRGKR